MQLVASAYLNEVDLFTDWGNARPQKYIFFTFHRKLLTLLADIGMITAELWLSCETNIAVNGLLENLATVFLSVQWIFYRIFT